MAKLHAAARAGNIERIEELLAAGADIDELSQPSGCYPGGKTPLRAAVGDEMLHAVEMLLVNGANPNLGTQRQDLPLVQAIRSGNLDIFLLLLRYCADPAKIGSFTALHHCAIWGRLTMTQILVQRGLDVNTRDEEGRTPLACTKIHGRTRVAAYLQSVGGFE